MSASFQAPITGTSLGAGAAPDAGDDPAVAPAAAGDEDERERAEDAWAIAIAQVLVEGVRPRRLPEVPERGGGDAAAVRSLNAEADTAGAGGSGETESAEEPARAGRTLPNRLITELSDSRLGRMELSVARGTNGLHIVINVADSHVKALIESEQALLWKSLQGCGLRIDSLKIGSRPEAGTALAPRDAAQERALARSRGNPNLRAASAGWRGYGASPDEDPGDDAERVDLTA